VLIEWPYFGQLESVLKKSEERLRLIGYYEEMLDSRRQGLILCPQSKDDNTQRQRCTEQQDSSHDALLFTDIAHNRQTA
jgi:hypothetical protein